MKTGTHVPGEKYDWLNPIAMSELQKAVRKRAATVVLNGTRFDIEYGILWKYAVTEDTECIKLSRADGGYVPFGYVSMKKILDFDFDNG